MIFTFRLESVSSCQKTHCFSSFTAVSTPIFATKYALESSWRDPQLPHSPRDHNFPILNFRKCSSKHFSKFKNCQLGFKRRTEFQCLVSYCNPTLAGRRHLPLCMSRTSDGTGSRTSSPKGRPGASLSNRFGPSWRWENAMNSQRSGSYEAVSLKGKVSFNLRNP